MKKNNLLLTLVFIISLSGFYAQTSCSNWNEYVDSKNTIPGTGFYLLESSGTHSASQAYHYSGPGKITQAQITGQIPISFGHAHLKFSIYNVDANNRPIGSALSSTNYIWIGSGTKTISFGSGGVSVNADFTIVVKVLQSHGGISFFNRFELGYTGDGEGAGEDLPSTQSVTSVNWVSILPVNDGDFYLVPNMQHFITADFAASATCNVAVGQSIDFTNYSAITEDSMFNTINLSGYSGGMTLYNWDFGDGGSSTLKNPSHAYSTPGVYTVTLSSNIDTWPMGGTSCSDTKTIQVSVGLDVVTSVITDLSCNGDNSGTIALTASGGDNNQYYYSLDGTSWQLPNNFTGLAAGTYTIYVQDNLGCVEQGSSVTVGEPSEIEISSPTGITLATCGNSDGSLLVIASGGAGALTYSLDNITYQATGEFNNLSAGTKTIYVQDGIGCMASQNAVVNNTSAPTVYVQSQSNVSCASGNDGTITLVGSGGTGALEYSIDGVNFQSSGNFTTVSAGYYNPIVKDVAGCIGTINCATVTEPCDVEITEPTEITFSVSTSDALCNGSSDGLIDIFSAIGGTGTISYSVDGVNFQSGSDFSGLNSGTYTVMVKDIAGCTSSTSALIGEPSAIVASIVSSTDVSCNSFEDGEFVAAATGGGGSYAYSLDGNLFYPGGDFYSLMAGTYTVDVIDANYCEASTTVTLTEPTAITAGITTGNSTCGNANGTMLAIAGGGSGSGYSYSIDGNQTSNGSGAFSGLPADNYFIIVTDGTGCEEEFDATVTDSDGPTIVSYSSTDVTCNDGNDGTVTITSVTGGTGTILYSIDGSALQSSNSFIGLGSGQHLVAVKDANGCLNTSTITLTQPSPFTIILTGTDVVCNGDDSGTISVNAAGGSGTLAYSVDAVNFQSSTLLEGITAGNHNVYVRDAGGCVGSDLISITEPEEINISTSIFNVTCANASDGIVYTSSTGGTGAYTYSLTLNGTYQSSSTFTGVSGGVHFVFVKDAANCVSSELVIVEEPYELVLNSNISDVSCSEGDDGVIDIDVQGGTTPYTYAWSNHKETQDIFNLEAGSYSVDIVDGNGCSISDNFTVSEPSNPIVVNGTITDATGVSVADGSIDVTITGGTAPYSYNWSNGEIMEDNSDLIPGVYSIIVTDANGCSSTAGFTVSWNVGINDVTEESTLRIFPNPASNMINIEQEGVIIDKITLINSIGELVKEVYPTNEKVQFEISQYHGGIYLLQVQIDGEVLTKRITIMK